MTPYGHELSRDAGAAVIDPRPHILVFDGEPEVLALFYDLFAGSGYRVSASLTAAPALDGIYRDRPQLILVGLVRDDGRSGSLFLRRLRREAATAGIPILTTAEIAAQSRTGAEPAWPERITALRHPFDIDDILAEVSRHVPEHDLGATRKIDPKPVALRLWAVG
jgi:CheY-like chemotaxis protein